MFDPDTINSIVTIGKSLVDFRNALKEDGANTGPMLDEINEQVAQLQTHLLSVGTTAIDLQSENSRLTDHVAKLKAEWAKMEDWSAEKEKYKLTAIENTVVYALKPDVVGNEPPHWICSRCYEDHQRSILSFEVRAHDWGTDYVTWMCSRCDSRITIPKGAKPEFATGS